MNEKCRPRNTAAGGRRSPSFLFLVDPYASVRGVTEVGEEVVGGEESLGVFFRVDRVSAFFPRALADSRDDTSRA
jgi:hypothetical protein